MDLKEKIKRFNKRWNIQDVESPEESFKKFKTRILNIFKNIDDHVTKESISLFCQFYGISEKWHSQMYGNDTWSTNISDRLEEEDNEIEFYKLLEVIFSLDIRESIGYMRETTYSKSLLLKKTKEAIDFSNLNVVVVVSEGREIFFRPKGEKILDEKLVDEILSFLNKKSNEHFLEALRFYQSKKFIKSAESLRRSTEEFLRFKLNNETGLKENISKLQKVLKKDNRDSNIRNILFQVFNYMDQYFNENSKHKDGDIDDHECEYLIYQTGLLLRYVNNTVSK